MVIFLELCQRDPAPPFTQNANRYGTISNGQQQMAEHNEDCPLPAPLHWQPSWKTRVSSKYLTKPFAILNSSVSNILTVSSANTFSRLFFILFARKHMRFSNQHTNLHPPASCNNIALLRFIYCMESLQFRGLIISAGSRRQQLPAQTHSNKLSSARRHAAAARVFAMTIVSSLGHTICCCLHPSIMPASIMISCCCPCSG